MSAPPVVAPDAGPGADPSTRVAFRATGSLADGVRVDHGSVPRAGDPTAPVEFALAALVSSQLATYRHRADELGIPLDDVEVEVEGELDARGFLGLAEGIRPGLDQVRITARPRGRAPAAEYVRLLADVDARCPVLDLFRTPPTVHTEVVLDA